MWHKWFQIQSLKSYFNIVPLESIKCCYTPKENENFIKTWCEILILVFFLNCTLNLETLPLVILGTMRVTNFSPIVIVRVKLISNSIQGQFTKCPRNTFIFILHYTQKCKYCYSIFLFYGKPYGDLPCPILLVWFKSHIEGLASSNNIVPAFS